MLECRSFHVPRECTTQPSQRPRDKQSKWSLDNPRHFVDSYPTHQLKMGKITDWGSRLYDAACQLAKEPELPKVILPCPPALLDSAAQHSACQQTVFFWAALGVGVLIFAFLAYWKSRTQAHGQEGAMAIKAILDAKPSRRSATVLSQELRCQTAYYAHTCRLDCWQHAQK